MHDEPVEAVQSCDVEGLRITLLQHSLDLFDCLVWDVGELEDNGLKQFEENEVNRWRFLPHTLSQLSQRLQRPLQQEEVSLFPRPDHLDGAQDLATDHHVA